MERVDEGCLMCKNLNPKRYKLCQAIGGEIGICGFRNYTKPRCTGQT